MVRDEGYVGERRRCVFLAFCEKTFSEGTFREGTFSEGTFGDTWEVPCHLREKKRFVRVRYARGRSVTADVPGGDVMLQGTSNIY